MTPPQPGPLTSVLTCPVCQHAHAEQMPTDACQWFYECTSCHTILKPLAGLKLRTVPVVMGRWCKCPTAD